MRNCGGEMGAILDRRKAGSGGAAGPAQLAPAFAQASSVKKPSRSDREMRLGRGLDKGKACPRAGPTTSEGATYVVCLARGQTQKVANY